MIPRTKTAGTLEDEIVLISRCHILEMKPWLRQSIGIYRKTIPPFDPNRSTRMLQSFLELSHSYGDEHLNDRQ